MQELVSAAEASSENYDASKDKRLVDAEPEEKKEMREMIMFKGQSKRLWNELYKVIYFLEYTCCYIIIKYIFGY